VTARRQGIHYGTTDEQTAGEVVWTQETEPIGLWAYAEPEPHAAVADVFTFCGSDPMTLPTHADF